VPGAIVSPQDVKATLRSLCDYYKDRDRSSPVPFLLERALRLLDKDFMQSVGDLAPGPSRNSTNYSV
jgi:type VI secretion system protein ImpA